jgi:hypothetical protein
MLAHLHVPIATHPNHDMEYSLGGSGSNSSIDTLGRSVQFDLEGSLELYSFTNCLAGTVLDQPSSIKSASLVPLLRSLFPILRTIA